MKKNFEKLYIIIVVLCLIVLGGMMFVQKNGNINEGNVQKPQLFRDGSLNESFMDDAESYVVKHFGFRNEILETYTFLQEKIFRKSAVDNVIVGEDGFLFLEETADDYTGNRNITGREVFQIQRTLELMQEYVETQNGKFLFVVAPNKNSLYDKMPYNYIKANEQSLAVKVLKEQENIPCVDLFQVFNETGEILYYATDTHWNEQGARLTYDSVMNKLDKEHDDFQSYSTKKAMIKGDLYQMLYPKKKKNEASYPYQKERAYHFVTKTRSHEEMYIVSVNENATDSLLMFRDSFANNWIPFFSDSYKYAIYDKRATLDLFQMEQYQSNTVIFEIAERNLNTIQSKTPLFMAPTRNIKIEGVEKDFLKQCTVEKKESYLWLKGILEENYIETESYIYLEKDGIYYELTPQLVDGEYGFVGCIPLERLEGAKLCLVGHNKNFECELSVKIQ